MKVLEWSKHFSHFKSMGLFSDAQGQQNLILSWRISDPFEILWLSSLPARIKENQSNMKELGWSQDLPHYNPMETICCHGNQSSDRISLKTKCSQSSTPMMLQMKFDLDRTADSEIFMFESVIGGTNRQTDGRTRLASHTISSPRAFCSGELMIKINKQVAQWATIAHLGASIMFGNTIIYDTQWQITLNLKQWSGINSNTQDILPVLVICKY